MSIRRSIFVLIVVTLALPVVVFVASASRLANTSLLDRSLQVYTVGRGTIEVTVSAIGTVEANRIRQLSFNGGGRITERLVEPGMFVRAGDVLVQLADEPQRLAFEQAEIALRAAELQRDQLLAGPDEAQLRVAQANVQSAQGAVSAVLNAVSPQDLRAAELAYEQAQQALADAVQARATAPGDQPEAAYALLDARVGQASFNVEIARLQLEALREGRPADVNAAYARLAQAQRELERLQAGPSPFELDRAEAAIAAARIERDQAQIALDRQRLVAPFDGVITSVNAEVGGLALPGVPIVELADLSELRLVVQVDEIDVRLIREGAPARVRLDALPEVALDAVLESIALVGTNNAGIVNYDVRVRLLTEDPRARVGMTAEAAVVVETRSDVLVVPNQYIRLDRLRRNAFVNLLEPDGTLREVSVTLGLQGQDSSEVIAGLREGDVIAVDLSGDTIPFLGG